MPSWRALPWPIATIDFEASSLDHDGYPIEVGLALWTAPDAPVLGWSSLIRPAWHWTGNGHWSQASAKVHGIRGRDLVANGREPADLARSLNRVLRPGAIAWCDGGPYDAHWLRALFTAASVAPGFTLGDWHRLAAGLGAATRTRALDWLGQAPPHHRARGDAERLLHALRHAVGLEPGPAGNLAERLPALAATAAPA